MTEQISLNGDSLLTDWIHRHETEYFLTARRLQETRSKFMSTDLDEAVDMLDKSYAFAVISQQTPVDRHEAAYVTYLESGTIPSLAMYHNQKLRWLNSTSHIHKINAARMLRSEADMNDVHMYIKEHFTGLSYMKAAFTLAMLGFTDRMCIDTNVAQLTGVDGYDLKSFEDYMSACDEITDMYPEVDMSPFMLQWVLFDFNRGVHSAHMPYFKSLGTWIERDMGTWRNKL